MNKTWKIAGINFDFRHMDHLLAYASREPNVEITGIAHEDPREMEAVMRDCGIPQSRVHTDWEACLAQAKPDLVILCPATGDHRLWVERMAAHGVHVLIEKPFATSLADADAMAAAMERAGRTLAINWPLAWYPPHVTAHRLLTEGQIGDLEEVHFYDGNRGSIIDRSKPEQPLPSIEERLAHWYYQEGAGGSLIDYLGYGATLATWYFGGRKPDQITAMTGGDPRLTVDEQSMTIARYGNWLSTFQTRWGTFTDPWDFQTQPKCGFVLKGTGGSIGHFDYESTVRLQNAAHPGGLVIPVDDPVPPRQNPVQYVVHCLETGQAVDGPLSVETSRIGQQVMDTALLSAREGKTLALLD